MSFVRKRPNILRDLPINPYVHVVLDGKRWNPFGLVSGGYELKGEKPGEGKLLFHHEFEELQRDGRLEIIDDLGLFSKLFLVPEADRNKMFLRFFWVTAAEEAIDEGLIPTDFKQKHMDKVILEKSKAVIKGYHDLLKDPSFDHSAPVRKAHGGAVSPNRKRAAEDIDPDTLVFTAKTLVKHLRTWRKAGALWDLLPKPTSHSKGGEKPDPRTLKYIDEHITNYAGEILFNPTGLCEYINAFVENDNRDRGEDAQVPLATRYSVEQAILELPAERVIGGRDGIAAAAQTLRHVGEGPRYKRLGEMVQFDCWSTHVHSILTEEALEELRKKFPDADFKRRITISAAIDMASKTFLAFDGGFSETAVLTTRTLRMCMSDKSQIAKAAGAKGSWHMRLAPEGGISDWGPGYRSHLFLSAAMSIFDRFTYAAAGRKNLRGMVERVFKTIDSKFVRRFLTGGTRSNVHEKGDYDPQARAQAWFHELLRLITTFIVDVYHYNQPSDGSLSPARMYQALYERYQPKPLPNTAEMRLAFGTTERVQLNRAGLRVWDILYWNSWLDPVLRRHGVGDYWVKFDPEDLGAISVLLGDDWTTIEGPPEFKGVRLDDWLEKKRQLRKIAGEQGKIDFREIVAPAIVDLAHRAAEMRAFHKIHDVDWSDKKVRDLAAEVRVYIVYDREAEGPEEALMGNSRMIGSVHTRSQAYAPNVAPPAKLLHPAAETVVEEPDNAKGSGPIEKTPPVAPDPASLPPAKSTRRARKHLPNLNPEK